MKHLIFAALVAAGLAGATLPADAGGHEWWRSCGGHAYEGCDGIPRGPYAHGYGHYRGHGYRRGSVNVEVWQRRTLTIIQNNWHVRCVNGECRCMSGICPH